VILLSRTVRLFPDGGAGEHPRSLSCDVEIRVQARDDTAPGRGGQEELRPKSHLPKRITVRCYKSEKEVVEKFHVFPKERASGELMRVVRIDDPGTSGEKEAGNRKEIFAERESKILIPDVARKRDASLGRSHFPGDGRMSRKKDPELVTPRRWPK